MAVFLGSKAIGFVDTQSGNVAMMRQVLRSQSEGLQSGTFKTIIDAYVEKAIRLLVSSLRAE